MKDTDLIDLISDAFLALISLEICVSAKYAAAPPLESAPMTKNIVALFAAI
ncbi:hypothetical protein JYT12_01120 [Beggiatoa alba]|nr:hypothetical protein [Beggiatoa alba]